MLPTQPLWVLDLEKCSLLPMVVFLEVHGFVVGHVTPSFDGGIALVRMEILSRLMQ
jgi:hypothetical protein